MGFAMAFLWLGLVFSLYLYHHLCTSLRLQKRVDVQIKGMAWNKPLLVQRVPIFLGIHKFPIFGQNSLEKQKLSPVAQPIWVVKYFTCWTRTFLAMTPVVSDCDWAQFKQPLHLKKIGAMLRNGCNFDNRSNIRNHWYPRSGVKWIGNIMTTL